MKLVRRARKSIRERRMKACINDLSSNLAKVEKRVFAVQKQERARARCSTNSANVIHIPSDVKKGIMNLELYNIECRLHKEAGLPAPRPYARYYLDKMRQRRQEQRIGFVPFASIVNAVRQMNKA